MKRAKWIQGIWNFDSSVRVGDLRDVAAQWVQDDPGYVEIYIRRTGRTQLGLGFTYETSSTSRRNDLFRDYVRRTSRLLRSRFAKSLVAWDISMPIMKWARYSLTENAEGSHLRQ